MMLHVNFIFQGYREDWFKIWYDEGNTDEKAVIGANYTFFPRPTNPLSNVTVLVTTIHAASDECFKRYNGSLPVVTSNTNATAFSLAFWKWRNETGGVLSSRSYAGNQRWYQIGFPWRKKSFF
jgi:hypothetical protein